MDVGDSSEVQVENPPSLIHRPLWQSPTFSNVHCNVHCNAHCHGHGHDTLRAHACPRGRAWRVWSALACRPCFRRHSPVSRPVLGFRPWRTERETRRAAGNFFWMYAIVTRFLPRLRNTSRTMPLSRARVVARGRPEPLCLSPRHDGSSARCASTSQIVCLLGVDPSAFCTMRAISLAPRP